MSLVKPGQVEKLDQQQQQQSLRSVTSSCSRMKLPDSTATDAPKEQEQEEWQEQEEGQEEEKQIKN